MTEGLASNNEEYRNSFIHIVEHTESLNQEKNGGDTPLAFAIKAKDFESVQALVKAGVNVNYKIHRFYEDIKKSNLEILKYLINHGIALDYEDLDSKLDNTSDMKKYIQDCIKMIEAVSNNKLQQVIELNDQGIPFTLVIYNHNPYQKGLSLGRLAIETNSVDIVRYFLEKQIISKDDFAEKESIVIDIDKLSNQSHDYTKYKQHIEIVKGVYSGDLSLLKKVKIESINADIIFRYKELQGTILHIAILKNSESAVKTILNKWPLSVNYPNKLYGSVPLITAIKGKSENIITLILAQTIKEHNFFPSNARSILKEEDLYKHSSSLEQIFASLTESDKNRINQEVIFHNFIHDKNKAAEIAVNMLLKYGIDVNYQGYQGYQGNTALHIACEYNSPKIAITLLSNNNIDPNIINDLGYTPLHLASLKGNREVVEVLLSNRNVDINACVDSYVFAFSTGLTDALDLALESGHYESAKALVRHGIKLNKNVAIVILYALKYKDLDFLEELSNLSQVLDKEDLGNFIYNWRSKHFSFTDYQSILKLLEDQAVYNKISKHIGKALKFEVQKEILKNDDVYATSASDNSDYESHHLVRFEKALKVIDFNYLPIATGYKKEILTTTEASITLFSEFHHIQHKYNIERIIQMIDNDDCNTNTVICIERKQYGKNFGIPDVITLAQILEYGLENNINPLSTLLQQHLPIYYDALLYNVAKTKGIKVIGIEGKGLAYPKESPYYHQTREEYMAEQLVAISKSGKNAIFLVGTAHIGNLVKLLSAQEFSIDDNNNNLLEESLIIFKSAQTSFPREFVLPAVNRDLIRVANSEHTIKNNPQFEAANFVLRAVNSYSFFYKFTEELDINWQVQKLMHSTDIRRFESLKAKYGITASNDVFRESGSNFRKSVLLKLHPDKNPGKNDCNDDFIFVTNLREDLNKPFDVQKYINDKVQAINSVVYKANIGFKILDTTVDAVRLIYIPTTTDNAKKFLIDTTYLYSMYFGVNGFSVIINGADVVYKVYQGEYNQAFIQTITTASYMFISAVMSFVAIPYIGFTYGTALSIYSGYSAVNNAYLFYQEYNAIEWQLKSVIAYKDVSEFLTNSPLQQIYNFAASHKYYEIKINDINLEIEKAQARQQLEIKGEFANKLYDYIYIPLLEEKYLLLNKVTNGELTKEQTEALKVKHVPVTIEEQSYEHCIGIVKLKEAKADHYYCYNEEQQILDHVLIGKSGEYAEVIERF